MTKQQAFLERISASHCKNRKIKKNIETDLNNRKQNRQLQCDLKLQMGILFKYIQKNEYWRKITKRRKICIFHETYIQVHEKMAYTFVFVSVR